MNGSKSSFLSSIPTTILAILFMVTAGLMVTFMQAGVKLLSSDLHPFIIVFFRAFLVLVILAPISLYSGLGTFSTSSYKLQIMRGLIGGSGMVCVFYGLSIVHLAEATTLLFTVPIFATILSVLIYKEQVGIRRWTAILFGFAGTFIVTRPDVAISLGHFLLLYAAFAWAISVLIAKKLTQSDSIVSITFWQAAGSVPIAFFLSLQVWSWPDLQQFLGLFGIAALGTAGHALMYSALRRGDVSFILPLDYLRLIWSATIGLFLFGDLPGINLFAGGIMIIGATSFISYREIKLKRAKSGTSHG